MSTISWSGGGDHEGHTITPTDVWPSRIEADVMTCGRVSCSCGVEWNVGGWPLEHFEALNPCAFPVWPSEAAR